jgi:hypothetical protein
MEALLLALGLWVPRPDVPDIDSKTQQPGLALREVTRAVASRLAVVAEHRMRQPVTPEGRLHQRLQLDEGSPLRTAPAAN